MSVIQKGESGDPETMACSPNRGDVAEQTVAHGAAGRADSELNVVRRGPVNGGVIRLERLDGNAYYKQSENEHDARLRCDEIVE